MLLIMLNNSLMSFLLLNFHNIDHAKYLKKISFKV